MKLMTMLLAAAGVFGAGILVERWRQQRLRRAQGDEGAVMGAPTIIEAEIVGIGELEPDPMAIPRGMR